MKTTIHLFAILLFIFASSASCTKYDEQVNFRLRSPQKILCLRTLNLHQFKNPNNHLSPSNMDLKFDLDGTVRLNCEMENNWIQKDSVGSFLKPNFNLKTILGSWKFSKDDKTHLIVNFGVDQHQFNIHQLNNSDVVLERIEIPNKVNERFNFRPKR